MGGLAHKDGHIIFVEAKKMLSQDYYFISTSGPSDVQSRVGGFCQSHNMKVVFKVLDPEMVAAAVEAAKSVERRVNLDLEVIRINSEIKPIIVTTKTSATTTERADRERRRKRKRKEKEESLKSTTKPSELQKFLAKRGFSSSSSRGPVSPKALILLFLLLFPQQHMAQLFPFLPR